MNPKEKITQYRKAILGLGVATILWGASFLLIKIIDDYQSPLANHWGFKGEFLTSVQLIMRYLVALGLLLPFVAWKTQFKIKRTELAVGLGTGVFSGLGMLLQTDGLRFTTASVSAFLTQAYCVILPLFELLYKKKVPSRKTLFCCGLLSIGILVLSDISWSRFHLGRGEIITLCSALMFALQIFWIDIKARPENNPLNVTLVYFLTLISVATFVGSLYFPDSLQGFSEIFFDYRPVYSILLLGVFCTFMSFVLMNTFQPRISPTTAGLLYSLEPVIAGILALFIPGWISGLWDLNYSNELLTSRLIWGGGLMLFANILLQLSFRKMWNNYLSFTGRFKQSKDMEK
jgi:drug/metabolite transporter (DMT)-like permease